MNPYDRLRSADFKSAVSADFTTWAFSAHNPAPSLIVPHPICLIHYSLAPIHRFTEPFPHYSRITSSHNTA